MGGRRHITHVIDVVVVMVHQPIMMVGLRALVVVSVIIQDSLITQL